MFAGQDSEDNYGLYRVDVVGSDVSILLQDAYIGSPTWSPDGSMIAFVRDDAGSGLFAISVMRPDGTGVRDLTGELDEAGSIDWQGYALSRRRCAHHDQFGSKPSDQPASPVSGGVR